MFAPNLTELLLLIGTVGVIGTILVYLYVRLVRWAPRQGQSLEHVRKHALWTGVIAWALSSVGGANRAGLIPAGPIADPAHPAAAIPLNPWDTIQFTSLFGPIAAVLLVHLIGQLTWPAPKSSRRVAVLEFRRVRDFVEPALGWTVLGIFTLSAAAVAWLAFAPGFPAVDAQAFPDGSTHGPIDGRVPGWILATALGAALFTLALGTSGVMRLIASRRSLEALDHGQNSTLRVIGMNRLLRVSATMASGIGAIAGNFLFQPSPETPTNWLAIATIAAAIAMFLWKPPFLDSEAPDAAYDTLFGNKSGQRLPHDDGPAAARLVDSGTPAVVMAALVGTLTGTTLITWLGWLAPVLIGIIFIMLTYTGLEFLLRRNYATPGRPRTRLEKALPWPMCAALAISAAGLAMALSLALRAANAGLGASEGWNGQGGPASFVLVPFCCAMAVLVVGALAALLVIRRPGLEKATVELDNALRRRSLFRISRTVAAGWFAILAALLLVVPYDTNPHPLAVQPNLPIFGALCIVLAALALIYPVRAFTPNQFLASGVAAQPGTGRK